MIHGYAFKQRDIFHILSLCHSDYAAEKTKSSWTIDGNELVFGEKLGAGTAAEVYKGTYRGQEVAIKVLQSVLEAKQIDNFKKELDIMRHVLVPQEATRWSKFLTICQTARCIAHTSFTSLERASSQRYVL